MSTQLINPDGIEPNTNADLKPFNQEIANKLPGSLRFIGIIDTVILGLVFALIQDYPTKEDFFTLDEDNGFILDNERNIKTKTLPVRSKSR